MSELELKEYYIGYLDILGYKELIKQMGEEAFLAVINEAFHEIDTGFDNLAFIEMRIFSDNIVITSRADDNFDPINFISSIITTQIFLLNGGILVRGSITKGNLHIDDKYLYGSGLIRAYELENDIAIMPRVILDRTLENEFEKLKVVAFLFIRDYDGLVMTDYLWSIEDPQENFNYDILKNYQQVITAGLEEYKDNLKILQKYLWCKEYHNRVYSNYEELKQFLIP